MGDALTLRQSWTFESESHGYFLLAASGPIPLVTDAGIQVFRPAIQPV